MVEIAHFQSYSIEIPLATGRFRALPWGFLALQAFRKTPKLTNQASSAVWRSFSGGTTTLGTESKPCPLYPGKPPTSPASGATNTQACFVKRKRVDLGVHSPFMRRGHLSRPLFGPPRAVSRQESQIGEVQCVPTFRVSRKAVFWAFTTAVFNCAEKNTNKGRTVLPAYRTGLRSFWWARGAIWQKQKWSR